MIGAGQTVTPEIQAQMDLLNIQQKNASMIARAKLKQNLMIGGGVLVGVGVLVAVVLHARAK